VAVAVGVAGAVVVVVVVVVVVKYLPKTDKQMTALHTCKRTLDKAENDK
jgi:hypothetical protein